MARPIKETPVLEGKDAARFDEIIKQNEQKKASQDEREQARQAYEHFGFARKVG